MNSSGSNTPLMSTEESKKGKDDFTMVITVDELSVDHDDSEFEEFPH